MATKKVKKKTKKVATKSIVAKQEPVEKISISGKQQNDENDFSEIKTKTLSDKVLVFAIATIIVILIGIFALKFILPEEKIDTSMYYEYNGFAFEKVENMWVTQVQTNNIELTVPLRYGALEVDTIKISGELSKDFYSIGNVFISFNPLQEPIKDTSLASLELAVNLAKINEIEGYRRNITAAYLIEHNDGGEYPVITCENTPDSIVYQLIEKAPAKITLDGNCITLQGEHEDLIKAVDRFLLYRYNILN